MADETTEAPAPDDSSADVEYLRAEMKKIVSQRDRAKAEAKALKESSTLAEQERDELEALRKASADADEKRKIEAGDFESLKTNLQKEKEAALAERDAARQAFARKVTEVAFAGAHELFGPNGLTTLPPAIAFKAFGDHVEYVPGKDGAPGRTIVRGLDGEVISENGEPVDFVAGMRALIEHWPEKRAILRAGGAAGSGSTGGSGDTGIPTDRAELVRKAALGDKAALAQLRKSKPQGIMQIGPAFDRVG